MSGEMAGRSGHDERSGDSRQGRPRGGEATEWDGDARSWPGMTVPREPQAPEGKGTATLKVCTAAELKCWSLSTHYATTGLHLSRKTFEGGDLHWRLLH